MNEQPVLTAEEELAFHEFLDKHPFIEAYANAPGEVFRPYAQLVWHEALRWKERNMPVKGGPR